MFAEPTDISPSSVTRDDRRPSFVDIVMAAIIASLGVVAFDLVAARRRQLVSALELDGAKIGAMFGIGACFALVLIIVAVIGRAIFCLGESLRSSRPTFGRFVAASVIALPLFPAVLRTLRLFFEGGQMKQYSGGGATAAVVAVGIFLGVVVATMIGLRTLRRHRRRGALALAGVCFFGAGAAWAADARFFPGSYQFLHDAASVVVLVALFVAVLLLEPLRRLVVRPTSRRAMIVAVAITLLLVAGAARHLTTFYSTGPGVRRLIGVDLQNSSRWVFHLPYRAAGPAEITIDLDGLSERTARNLRLRNAARERVADLVRSGAMRNLVYISVDALRADHCSFQGYDKNPTTPFLAELAEKSFVFTAARSPAPSSYYSIASKLSGIYPATLSRTQRDPETLAHHLGRGHHRTIGFINPVIFTVRDAAWPPIEGNFGFETRYEMRESPKVVDVILDDLRGVTKPFFVYAHMMDPHHPYRRHKTYDFGNDRLDRYDSEIARVDASLRRLMSGLRELGRADDTIFVLTADHGEEFGEHGAYTHGANIYDTQVHVPFLVYVPAMAAAARRIETPISTASGFGTLIDLMGLDPVATQEAPSLLPLMLDLSSAGDDAVVVVERPTLSQNPGKPTLRGIVQGRFKMVADLKLGLQELYDVADDPGETRDLAASRPDVLERLRRAEVEWRNDCRLLGIGTTPTTDSEFPSDYVLVREKVFEGDLRELATLPRFLGHDDPVVRHDAAVLLYRRDVDPKNKKKRHLVVPADGIGATDPVILGLADAVQVMKGESDSLGATHLALLEYDDVRVRRLIARSLRESGQIDAVSLARRRVTKDDDAAVLFELRSILVLAGDRLHLDAIFEHLATNNPQKINDALAVLVRLPDDVMWARLLGVAEHNGRVRNYLARALAGASSPKRLDWLAQRWRERSDLIRRSSFMALARTDDKAFRDRVLVAAALYDPSPPARRNAVRYLRRTTSADANRALGLALGVWEETAPEIVQAASRGKRALATGDDWVIASRRPTLATTVGKPLPWFPDDLRLTLDVDWRLGGVLARPKKGASSVTASVTTASGRSIVDVTIAVGEREATFVAATRLTAADLPLRLVSKDASGDVRIYTKGFVASRIRHHLETWPQDIEVANVPYVTARFQDNWRAPVEHPFAVWLMRSSGRADVLIAAGVRQVRLEVWGPKDGAKLRLLLDDRSLGETVLRRGRQIVELAIPADAVRAGQVQTLEFRCSGRVGRDGDDQLVPRSYLGLGWLRWS